MTKKARALETRLGNIGVLLDQALEYNTSAETNWLCLGFVLRRASKLADEGYRISHGIPVSGLSRRRRKKRSLEPEGVGP